MLGASISKEKVKSLTVPRLFVIFSLLLLLQSCDWQNTADLLRSNTVVIFNTNFSFCKLSTVVTKENLHLKNNSKLTTMCVSHENDN